ncbi:MAG: HYR domain-containing protein, partial [Bacteroidota bacterium]
VTPANSTITLISPLGTEVEITTLPASPEDFYVEKTDGDWILDIVPNPGQGALDVTDWDLDITCMLEYDQPDVTLDNDPGLCGAEFSWIHPFFVDNCFQGTISVAYSTLDADCVPDGGVLPGVGGMDVTEFFCVGTTTVTYTLVDLAGNVSTCGFDVTVLDVEDPVIECPADITINLNSGECRRSVCFAPELAIDNCEVVDTVYSIEPCSFFEIGITPVTITIFDEAGNSATCTFNIEIIEYVPNSFDLFCNDLVNISLDATCEAEITADMIFEGDDYHCYEDYIITITDQNGFTIPTSPIVNHDHIGQTLTVTVFDPDSGNSCWGQIFIEDKQDPEIACPDDLTIYCHESSDPSNTGTPELLSCETSVTNTFNDVWNDFGACEEIRGEIIRTWTVTDESDNFSTCVQVITIKRFTTADVVFPENIDGIANPALACADVNANPSLLDPANTGTPSVLGMNIQGAPLCGLSVNMTEEIFDICGGSYDILRVWSVYDPCLPAQIGVNPVQFLQTIKVIDNLGPNVTCPEDLTISTTSGDECIANYQIPAIAITDNCSGFTVTTDTPNGTLNTNGGLISNLALGTYTITYHVKDDCGNTTDCSYQLTVEDQTAPVAICDEITEVDLSSDGLAIVPADVFDDGSYDNCCLEEFQVRRMDGDCDGNFDDFGPTVEFCCSDAGNNVMVVFRVLDCYGNYNECMVQVLVNDKLPPLLIECPANATITCEEYFDEFEQELLAGNNEVLDPFGTAVFYDNCELDVVYEVLVDVNTCATGMITRTWTATDANTNLPISCTQTIFIEHVSDWVVEFPEDITAQCEDGVLPEFGEPQVFFDDCELIATSFEDELFEIVPDACYKIVRTWSVINWCVFDDFGFDAYSEAGFAECDLFVDWDGDGDQDCRTFRDGFNSNGTPGEADGYIEYQQTIKVVDEEAPIFDVEDLDVCIEESDCATVVNLPIPDVTDCSPSISIEISSDLPGATGDQYVYENVAPGSYDVLYTVTDECGNVAYDNIVVTVEDCKKPTPYCVNGLVIEIMQTGMIDVWASDFDAGSFDNCPGELYLSFSADITDTGLVFTCDDLGMQTIQLWVTDAAGNQDFCETFIEVQDNMGTCSSAPLTVAGTIQTENNQPVEAVNVEANGGQSIVQQTDNSGQYSFNLAAGGDYSITPSLNDEPTNGVTTFDIVLITQHILGVNQLDSPYKMIAADANNSGAVSTLDIVAIRKVILLIDDSFQNNTSWRFVPEDFVFANPQNPFAEPFDEVINFNNLSVDQLFTNFIGIKVGDVNGSVQANSLVGNEERTNTSSFVLQTEDRYLKAGESAEVWFTGTGQTTAGFQFSLEAQSVLSIDQVLEGSLTNANIGSSNQSKGLLHFSWNTDGPVQVDAQSKQFGLLVTAQKDGMLSEWLGLAQGYVEAQSYPAIGEIEGVQVVFKEPKAEGVFALYSNRPNPFANSTSIRFQLPEAASADLQIFDASGRVVYQVTRTYAAGYHEVILRQSDLNTTGLLYYQLKTETHSAIRRMLILE